MSPTTAETLGWVFRQGGRLRIEGDTLFLTAPQLPDEIRQAITDNKKEIMNYIIGLPGKTFPVVIGRQE